MMKINISENKELDYIKPNKCTSPYKNAKILPAKCANSSMASMESQGRAIVNMSKLHPEGDFHDYFYEECLSNTDLSEDTIKELMQLTPEQRKEAIDLYQEGIINESSLVEFVQEDPEVKQKLIEMFRKGLDTSVSISYIHSSSIDDECVNSDKETILKKCDELNYFFDSGIDPMAINLALGYDVDLCEDKLQRLSFIWDKIIFHSELFLQNCCFSFYDDLVEDDEHFQRVVELFNRGLKDIYIIDDLSETSDIYQKGLELIDKGYSEADLPVLVSFEDEESLKEVVDLMKKSSFSASEAKAVLQSPNADKQLANIEKFLDNDVEPISRVLNWSDDIIDGAIQLQKDGYTKDEIMKLIRKSPVDNDFSLNYYLNELIETNDKQNAKWNDFISKSPYKNEYEKEFDIKDIKFLKQHIFDNKYYSPDEYIKLYRILKNLKTVNGDNILSNESFYKKAETNGIGDIAACQKDELNKNIEALLSVDPESKKADYLKTILKLMQQGYVNPSALRKLSDLNELKSLHTMILGFNSSSNSDSVWDISNNLKDDIDLISQEGINSINYIDKYIPTYKTSEEGLKNTKIGDAFVLEGEKYIRIKISDNKSQTVELTKETYAKLFPPVDRFLSSQQVMGNCYCIETLMSLYCNDNTRIKLLETMHEDSNGDVTIKMGNYKPVKFINAKLPQNENPDIYSSGADGYKLFEYAYSCALVEDKINEAHKKLTVEKLDEFNNFINSNPDNFFIYEDEGEIKWTCYDEAVKSGLYKQYSKNPIGAAAYKTFNNYLLGNCGLQTDVYKKLGFDSKTYIDDRIYKNTSKTQITLQLRQMGFDIDDISSLNKLKRLLNEPDFFQHHQIQLGAGMHAYSLTQEYDEDGELVYYLYNPHNQGFPIKFKNLDDLFQKAGCFTVIDFD